MTPADHRLLFHGGTFAALQPSGDITTPRGLTPDGLFVRDARHLSRWQLTVDGATPAVLRPAAAGPDAPACGGPAAACVLTPPSSRGEPPAHTVFRRQRVTAGALIEELRVVGNRAEPETVRVALTADADFADQFELRSDHRWYAKPGAVRSRTVRDDGVEFHYRRRDWSSRTVITADPPPDAVEETGSGARRLVWELRLAAHGSAALRLRVTAYPHGGPDPALTVPVPAVPAAVPAGVPRELARACERGLADLAGLLIPAEGPDGEIVQVPAAGVPWYQALFGRHALIASLFALPVWPAPAPATLAALAATQAADGKIVHEVRHGELAHFGQVPFGTYYGAVDSTPLFLTLLGACTEHSGDDKLALRLQPHARAAAEWMFRDGGLDERGYLLYRPDDGGLANQSWKDSADAICFADGTRPHGAIAAAAPQGYAYDALRHTSRLARTVWHDTALADRLDGAADGLRARFVRDFWLAERDFPALALDGEGRRVDALASDAGHLLWSGLLDAERAGRVGERLLEPDFFSGWGVRTLAAGQPAYHPLSYHRGGVWPHDNALIALGLTRYGLHDQARTIAHALTDLASACPGHRLPEVIAGYARTEHPLPVPYPHACEAQAWAAAAAVGLVGVGPAHPPA